MYQKVSLGSPHDLRPVRAGMNFFPRMVRSVQQGGSQMVRAPGGIQRAHLEYAEDGMDRFFQVLNGKLGPKVCRVVRKLSAK